MQRKNDEIVLSALIAAGSIRTAAKIANVSESTIRTRLNDPDFRERYEQAKKAILTEACDALSSCLTRAIDTLREVIEDTKNAPTVRVSAASEILRYGLRYIEVANILTRLDALEQRTNHE
jgi:transposase